MVWLNNIHQNKPGEPGMIGGGAICMCPKCRGYKEYSGKPLRIFEGTVEEFIEIVKKKKEDREDGS